MADYSHLATDQTNKQSDSQIPSSGIDYSVILQGKSIDEPVGEFEAGEPGIQDKSLRYQMARGSNLQEKLVELREHYGENADLALKVFDGGKPTLAFREHDKDKWKKVDKDFLDMDRHEFVRDLIDFAGEDLESLIGEIGSVLTLHPAGRTVSLIKLALRAGAGAGAGEVVKEAIEVGRGKQQETAKEIAIRAAGKAGFASVFAPVGEVVTRKVVDLVKGSSLTGLKRGAREAIEAAEELGVPVPPVHYLVSAPWIQKMGAQSEALVPRIRDYVETARESTEAVLARLVRAAGGSGNIPKDLARLTDAAENRVKRLGTELLSFERRTGDLRRGAQERINKAEIRLAEDLKGALAEWNALKRAQVDEAYNTARLIEEPEFDLAPLRESADALLQGQSARRFIEAPVESTTTIVDVSGKPIRPGSVVDEVVETEVEGVAVPQMSAEVIRVLKEISETSRMEAKGEFTPTAQLNYWAEVLADNMIPAVGDITRREHKLARDAFNAIRETLNNPLNKNPQFVKAWGDARKLASDRFTVLEKEIVREAMRTERPQDFVRRFFVNQDADLAKSLRAAVTNKRWREVQDTFFSQLIRDPRKLTERLNSLNPEFRKAMMGDKDLSTLSKLGIEFDKVSAMGLDAVLEKSANLGQFISNLVADNNTLALKGLTEFIRKAGGLDSDIGKTVRAALLEDIYQKSLSKEFLQVEEGMEVGARFLDAKALREVLKEYKGKGLYELLRVSDVGSLGRLAQLEKILQPSAADAGSSIQAAEQASGLRRFRQQAFQNLLQLVGVGRLLTSNAGRRILLGKGRESTGFMRKVASLSGALGVIASDIQSSEAEIDKLSEALR